jgi:type I restriction enzyme, S subunit
MRKSIDSTYLKSSIMTVTLSEVSKLFDCKHYTPAYADKGIPLIRTNDVKPGFFEFGKTALVSENDYEKLTDVNKPKIGDIVFSREGSFGVASYVKDRCRYAIGQRMMIIRANPLNVNPVYLTYFINSSTCQDYLLAHSMGTTVKRVNVKDVREIPVRLPPLEEQERITAIASKADHLRRTRRYTQQLSDTYLQSVFLEMFGDPVSNPKGWEKVRAGELFEIQLGKMLSEKSKTGKNSRPYLANFNVQWGRFDIREVRTMDFTVKEFEKFRLRKGDILVCEGGESGRTAIWQEEIEDCCYQKALHRLRKIKPIIDEFYFLHFMKVGVKLGLIEKETSLATIAHFTAEKFREFPINLPPLPLQQKFATIVQNFERLRTQQREAERQAEHLFQSILHRAFRGEL